MADKPKLKGNEKNYYELYADFRRILESRKAKYRLTDERASELEALYIYEPIIIKKAHTSKGNKNHETDEALETLEIIEETEPDPQEAINKILNKILSLKECPLIIKNLLRRGMQSKALSIACKKGYTDIAKALMKIEPDIEILDDENTLYLVSASFYGYRDIVAALLDVGANIESKSDITYSNKSTCYSCTPLIAATISGNLEIVIKLLEMGADVESADGNGNTPIIWASFYGYTEIAKILIELGANVNAKDEGNKTAFYYANKKRYTEMLVILKTAGAES